MMNSRRYTLDELNRYKMRLAADVKVREERLQRKWTALVTPPTFEDRFSLWTNRANAAFSLYDGFMTGFKLLRRCSSLFRRKKSGAKVRRR